MRRVGLQSVNSIPSLDGLRAVSILLVIIGHAANSLQVKNHPLATIFGNAGLGVEIFFVISGYLITTLLMREFASTGSISLPDFYARRAFRIMPAFFFYLMWLAILSAVGWVSLPDIGQFVLSLFLWDYWRSKEAWFMDHIWSLSIEEQFYFLWPLLLLVTLRRGGRRIATAVALAVILVSPLLRVVTYLVGSEETRSHIYYMFHTRADSLMFGALCALGRDDRHFEAAYRVLASRVFAVSVFVFVLSPFLTGWFGGGYIYTVGLTMEGLAIATILVWAVRNSESTAGTILNSAPLVAIGITSYSLYLWQTIFLHESNRTITGVFPLNLLAVGVCAAASYFLVEKPFLRLRHRLSIGENRRVVAEERTKSSAR